ncbi:hypothetical protein ES708_11367 [subsurface metagenome]
MTNLALKYEKARNKKLKREVASPRNRKEDPRKLAVTFLENFCARPVT